MSAFVVIMSRSDRDENTSKATVVTFDRDGREVEHVIERSKVASLSCYAVRGVATHVGVYVCV